MTDIRAAGILLMHQGRALVLLRADGLGWCLPGGGIEEGENAAIAAVRELQEETGIDIRGHALAEFARRIKDGVDFTTFITTVDDEPAVTLNDEHTGYAWVAPEDLTGWALHPGMPAVMTKLTGNELDVARLIRDGELSSPQQFFNVHLFAIRITGTGTAYRSTGDEFVFRDPAHYLNDEFLARCNGLPVIYEHPDHADGCCLTSDEFNQRIVGTVMLPYIHENDVWGIAKIYDADTVSILKSTQMSTSPGVKLRISSEDIQNIDDGGKLLIEQAPILLDHIAICERGVWDKLGDPTGIISESVTMSKPNEGDEPEAKAEGVTPDLASTLTAIMDSVNKLSSRMDSMETKAEEKADEAEDDKADSEEEEKADSEEEEKVDSKEDDKADKADSQYVSRADMANIMAKLDALSGKVTKVTADRSDADNAIMADTQARADAAALALGEAVNTKPMAGESPTAYRSRMASRFQKHAEPWKDTNLSAIAKVDAQAFTRIEAEIYDAANKAAHTPAARTSGNLRAVKRQDETGRHITEYYGDIGDAFGRFYQDSRKASPQKPVNTLQ